MPLHTHIASLQNVSSSVAGIAAIALMFGVTTSVALTNFATALLILAWLLGGGYRTKWLSLKQSPLTLPITALVLLMLIGTTYSVSPSENWSRHLIVYLRLLVLLILIHYLQEDRLRARCWIALAIGGAITLASTYLNLFIVLPWSKSTLPGWGKDHSVFHDHIAQGVIMTFLSIVLFSCAATTSRFKLRIALIVLGLFVAFSVTHLIKGRTGYLMIAGAFLVSTAVCFKARKRAMGLALIAGYLVCAYYTSPTIEDRIAVAQQDLQLYARGDFTTSLGYRLESWKVALDFFLASPLVGHGTGAFRTLAESVFLSSEVCKVVCIHPHNQYLFFMVEYGLLGLVAYLWLIAAIIISIRDSLPERRFIVLGLLTMLVIDGFINSPLWTGSLRNFYTAMLPLALMHSASRS